jgi:hypothetical protein
MDHPLRRASVGYHRARFSDAERQALYARFASLPHLGAPRAGQAHRSRVRDLSDDKIDLLTGARPTSAEESGISSEGLQGTENLRADGSIPRLGTNSEEFARPLVKIPFRRAAWRSQDIARVRLTR